MKTKTYTQLVYLYLLLPLILTLVQAAFTFNSLNQIRYEELAESVRNVFWLQYRTIYDGVSSNVGWYATLLLIYNLFGFSLHTAKFFRLFLHLISLLCLALLLKKYLPLRFAIVSLVTIALSPTLLYFNTLQVQYGIDLQYLPIVIYFLTLSNLRFFAWFIAMLAWMSYPTFAFYLPALAFFYWRQLKKTASIRNRPPDIVLSFIYFLAPVLLAFFYVKDKNLLFYDPVTKTGLFRGAGKLVFDLNLFSQNAKSLFDDLFFTGKSYYFELKNVEFSHVLPFLAVILILVFSFYLACRIKNLRPMILTAFSTMLINFFIASFSLDTSYMPGLRRQTPLLAGFYLLFFYLWYFISHQSPKSEQRLSAFKIMLISISGIILVHHLLVAPSNIGLMPKPSIFAESQWFKIKATPSQSLETFINAARYQGLKLNCITPAGQLTACRYSEIYAAVAGYCIWNRLTCQPIYGYDLKQKTFIPISIKLWENYYLQH